ncbi:MAG: ABC transporter permease [Candidatus Asgardarchaeia archaeon]
MSQKNYIIISNKLADDFNLSVRSSFALKVRETPLLYDQWCEIPNVTVISIVSNYIEALENKGSGKRFIIMNYKLFFKYCKSEDEICYFLIGVQKGKDLEVKEKLSQKFPYLSVNSRVERARENLYDARRYSNFVASIVLVPLIFAFIGYLINTYFFLLDRRQEIGMLSVLGASNNDFRVSLFLDICLVNASAILSALVGDIVNTIIIPLIAFTMTEIDIGFIKSYFLNQLVSIPLTFAIELTLINIALSFAISLYLLNRIVIKNIVELLRNQ